MMLSTDQFKEFTDRILKEQTLTVDVVSGCTQDCEAVVAAIQKALDASTK